MMVYYNLSELIPEEDGVDHFQYFVEIENEIENRMNILESSTLFKVNMKKLIKVLKVNPYAKIIRRLKDYPSMNNVQLRISKDVKLNQRVYNFLTDD